MGTLTMALAAALVAGSAPEKVSGEVEQRLDLRGEWAGCWRHKTGTLMEATLAAKPKRTFRIIEGRSESLQADFYLFWIVDDRNGRFRLRVEGLGIYAVQGDRVLLCYRHVTKGYPTTFYGGDGQHLITLCRLRPCK